LISSDPYITLSSSTNNNLLFQIHQYSTADEEITRYAIFKQSLKEVDALNAGEKADNGTAVFGITVFADMSPQEFRSQYLGAQMPDESERKLIETKSVVAYTGTNTVADWRSTQTTPVKDQGGCGSCW
jgi:cathepsin F